ncbi:unnamed protein product [Periconia digitata]|uniref:Uncharacterized protein n=1 Tax=Periconia digitata TaxID=1303443 RepID=A0A9W4ULX4_9PLEO|nr:unnamed protein product [Periconia digitata]
MLEPPEYKTAACRANTLVEKQFRTHIFSHHHGCKCSLVSTSERYHTCQPSHLHYSAEAPSFSTTKANHTRTNPTEHCIVRSLGQPMWQDISDRRGGRTAWSSVVAIQGNTYQARFWYDGAYVEQAREDAAEVALRNITGYLNPSQDPPPASHYSRA